MTAEFVSDSVDPARDLLAGESFAQAPNAPAAGPVPDSTFGASASAAIPDTSVGGLDGSNHLGPLYEQVIISDFLGPGPLSLGRRLYLVVLNYCLPAGLLHVWPQASFRICADGGCNRLHDELPSMVPPPPAEVSTTIAEAETETEAELDELELAAAMASTDGAAALAKTSSCDHGRSVVGASAPNGNVNGASVNGHTQHGTSDASSLPHHQHQLSHSAVERSVASAATASVPPTGYPPLDCAASLRLGHMPDMVLGDLDSLRPDVRQFYVNHGVPFVDLSYDQDTNDLTKAVMLIQERFIDSDPDPRRDKHQILVLGALGGRLDHTLANLNVLHMFPDLNITLWGDGNLVRLVRPGTTLIRPDERFEGPTCGLIPIAGPVTGSSTGLRWNLADTQLRVGGLVSSSNLLTGAPVEVRCDGPLLWSTEMRAEPRPDLAQLWARTTEAAAAHMQQKQREAPAASQEASEVTER